MVNIKTIGNKVIFEVKGIHKLWAFRNKITVNRKNIVKVYHDPKAVTFWKGIRAPGTEIPWVISAGTYYQNGKNFWDVTNKKNTIIVELQNENFKKLYIDVENPIQAIQLLKNQ